MILHAFVKGVVQGVFFRANTQLTSKRLGLKGWVKNLSNGRVEVLAEGDKKELELLLKYLHNGPVGSKVEKVEYEYSDESKGFKEFTITY